MDESELRHYMVVGAKKEVTNIEYDGSNEDKYSWILQYGYNKRSNDYSLLDEIDEINDLEQQLSKKLKI